jgi:cyclopropane-fatty-acyl-phospholipid synthase
MAICDVLAPLLEDGAQVRFEAYDGSAAGPLDAPATVVIRSPEGVRRLLAGRMSELACARAYVAGEVDLMGDIYTVLQLRDRLRLPRLGPAQIRQLARALDIRHLSDVRALRPPPPPAEEIRVRGRRHSRRRDAAAVSAHYDVSGDFYRLILGSTMVYSCAVFDSEHDSLSAAQVNKLDLICRKLDLREGQRLLDIGCGWGSLLIHAAQHYDVVGVGITLAHKQADLARKRVADAGVEDRVEIRVQDYRDLDEPAFDAISSVGMFEHVGLDRQRAYFGQVYRLLAPGGRFLNHAIARPSPGESAIAEGGFVNRFVFADGELHEVGAVVSAMQDLGLEVRHLESIREHYALTLRHWVSNLEREWGRAIDLAGEGRARVWKLYMAASAVMFEGNDLQVHQVLAVRPDPAGVSGFPLRPDW